MLGEAGAGFHVFCGFGELEEVEDHDTEIPVGRDCTTLAQAVEKMRDRDLDRIGGSPQRRDAQPVRAASYFCACWKVRPGRSAGAVWLMPSAPRRSRRRDPTWTSIGSGPSA